MAASRISVEISGSSSELQAAVAKASESLKGLSSVLAKQTDLAMAAGDRTVRMNNVVADSYKRAAGVATSSSRQAAVSYSRSSGEQVAASERMTRAMEAQARAAKLGAEQQVRANDMAAASAARAAARQEAAAAKSKTSFGAANSQITRMGRTMSAGLLGAAAASTYLAVKFQANTTRLQTQAGATAKQVDKLRKGILDMAGQVGFVPNKLADGMYHVVSSMNAVLPATTRVREELQILKVAAEGAQIGHSNLEDTTYALASAMNALHQRGSDAQKTMGQLNAIVGAGDMTMTDLLKALESGLIPAARTFHISLQSVGSALAVMGDMGMRGALAGTRLRMSIALLGAPSAKAAKYLEAIGMSSKQALASTAHMSKVLDAAGLSVTTLSDDLKKPNGLAVALQDLDHHLRSSGLSANAAAALISRAFGGGRSGAAIQLMAQNTDRLNIKFKQIGDGASNFGKDWAATQHTLAFELKSTEATAVALGTKLGTDLLPVVHSLLGDLKDTVHWFEQNHAAVVALEAVVGTFAAVTIGSLFVSKISQAIKLAMALKSALTFGVGTSAARAGAGAAAGAVAGEAGTAAATGAGAAAAGGLAAAASGLVAVGGIAGLAVVAGLAAQHILNKGIKLPGGTSAQGVNQALQRQGAGFANVDIISKLKKEGAFGGARANADAYAGGRAVAESLQKGWSQYKFQSEPIMITQLVAKLRGLRPRAQAAAAESAIAFASKLEQEGKLPAHSADMMLAQLEQRFPALTAYMGKTARDAVAAFHVNFDMKRTESDLKSTLNRMRGDFPQVVTAMDQTRGSIETKSRAVITSLRNIIATGTVPMRQQAKRDLDALVRTTDSDFGSMVSTVKSNTASMKNAVSTNTNQSFQIGSANFKGLAANIAAYVGSGAAATAKGLKNITDQVNAELKKFSGGSVSVNQVQAASPGQLAALISGQVSAGAFTSPHAGGGFIGAPGEKGRDQVPIVVGRGEAVLNHSQQRVVNAALRRSGIGGLPEVFSKVTTPHFMARGGYASGGQVNAATNPQTTGGTSSYVSPFPSGTPITWERQDAGQDMVVPPGTPVLAIADGGITGIAPNWYLGQPLIEQSIANGPEAGKFLYYAEGITPRVSGGAVKAGQQIATTTSQPTGLEFGWGGGGTSTLRSVVAGGGDSAGPWSSTYATFLQGLVAGHTIAVGGIPGGVGGAAPVVTWKDIKTPTVGGSGAVSDIVRATLKKATAAANTFGKKKAASSSGGVSGGSVGGTGSVTAANLSAIAASLGYKWDGGQISDWLKIIAQESGGNPTAQNPTSTAYGIGQFLDSTWGLYGTSAKTSDPHLQLVDMAKYIHGKYGTPAAAEAFHIANNSYAGGGIVKALAQGGPVAHSAAGGNVWRVRVSQEDSSSGDGWTELSNNGNAANYLGIPQTASGTGGWDFTTLGRMYPKGTRLNIAANGRSGTFPLTDFGNGSSFAPAIGLTPAAYGALGGMPSTADISMADGSNIYPKYARMATLVSGSGGLAGGSAPAKPAPPSWSTGLSWQGDKHTRGMPWIINPGGDKHLVPAGKPGGPPLETLAGYGTQLGDLETKIAGWNSQYQSLSSRFSVTEQGPQFLNADGSVNAAGIGQQTADDQTLLALAQNILGGYQQELPLVSTALTQFLGARAGTQGTITADTAAITANRKKIAANKVREASIRTAMLNLQKPSKDEVGALERAIKAAQNKYGPLVKSAEAAKGRYHGKDKTTKHQLQDAVIAARQTEQAVLQPLEDALLVARGGTAQRKQRVKAETFHLRQQLQGLVSDDTRLSKTDTGLTGTISDLKGILTGKGGAQGENQIISSLESVAAKLGTVMWGKGGQFLGIDTSSQGAAFDEQTTIDQLHNTLSQLSGTAASGSTVDTSLINSLLQQENLQLSQALELGNAQTRALLSMIPEIPQYKDGGPTIQGLSMLHDDEFVVPQGGALVKSGGSQPVINLTIEHHGAMRELSQFIDQRVTHDGNVRVISKKIGQRTSMLTGAPGGFR